MRVKTQKAKSVYDQYGLMAGKKYTRILINQRAYEALVAETIRQHRPIRDIGKIATEVILANISEEVIASIDILTAKPKDQETNMVKDQSVEKTPVPDEPPPEMSEEDQKRYAEFNASWSQREKEIDEEFGGTTPTPAKGSRLTPDEDTTIRAMYLDRTPVSYIALEIGRSESTVRSRIKRLIKKGELAERKMAPGDERALLASLSKECIKDTRDSGE